MPTLFELSSPRKVPFLELLFPEDEGTIFLRNVVTVFLITQLNIAGDMSHPKQPL
jgi:hypothetical protein